MAGTGFVVGVDGGGTSTRAVALGLDGDAAGTLLGSGYSGGANPNAHPPGTAAGHVAAAVRDAMDGLDPALARGGVLGLAGDSKLTDPAVAEVFAAAWRSTGLRRAPRVVSDAEAAFAAATAEPAGTALVAGTGAIAARIVDHRLVRTAGGYGWLLGDEGSAFWIGREAVRHTLGALDAATTPTPLSGAVLAEALGTGTTGPHAAHRLITAVNAASPVALARFAPLVSRAAADGDTAATAILARATDALAATATAVREPGERSPVVLIGGLLEPGGPLTDRMRAALAPYCGEILLAGAAPTAGAAGAAWLAALDVLGPSAPRPVTS